jgi:hypothetical protein
MMPKLRTRETRFGAKVLEAMASIIGATDAASEPDIAIRLRDAMPGMRLREEIRTASGALLVPIGFEISLRLLERITQVAPEVLDKTVRLTPAPRT